MVHELRTVFSAINCYIGLLLIGFEVGYVSPTAHALIRDTPLTIQTLPIFTGMIFPGSLIMQCVLSLLSQKVHTKVLLIASTLPGCIGWLTVVVSHDMYTMLFGRFLLGVQTSVLFLTSVYLGEIVSIKRRRFYCSGVSLVIRFSLVLIYFIGIWASFRWLAVIAILIEFVSACLMVVNPVSPVWLSRHGIENRRTNTRLHGEIIDRDSAFLKLKSSSIVLYKRLRTKLAQLFNWKVIKPILTVLSVAIFNPLSGIPAIISYSSEILSAQEWISSNVAALFFPVMLLLGNVIGQQLVFRYSLRVILITATTLQLLSHISMACYFGLSDYLLKCAINKCNICDNLSFWPVLNLTVFGLSAGIGLDSVTFTLFGEAFEENNREFSICVVHGILTIVCIVVIVSFPMLLTYTGGTITYSLLSGILLVSLPIEYFCIGK